uniref:sulfite exporter TauE/SafE family protein n=1 Tax=Thaumasiovibrio occultus TaxID=1891184 RepID=UPI000B353F95|nr:sulfite exporter TauE/SafE family protein [Thaumasiovibrio occultus]
MSSEILAAFFVGLAGAGHCLGMCGGISAAIAMQSTQENNHQRWLVLLLYNIGRIISYGIAGLLLGATFANLGDIYDAFPVLILMRFVAAVFMILLGLYITKWWAGLVHVERLGQGVWRQISPLAKRLLPLKHQYHALPLGMLWGWLPCGLVYSTLSWATVSGSGMQGAMIMISFGFGTLPAMLGSGLLAEQVHKLIRNSLFNMACGTVLIVYGLHTGYIALQML